MIESNSKKRIDRAMSWSCGYFGRAAGGIFLFAGVAKVSQYTLKPPIAGLTVFPAGFSIATALFEIILGTILIFGCSTRLMKVIVVALGVVFAAISALNLINGVESCGCFGAISISPSLAFVVDILIVALGAKWKRSDGPSGNKTQLFIAFGALLPAGVIGYLVYWSYSLTRIGDFGDIATSGLIVVDGTEEWVGIQLPLLPYMEQVEEVYSGRWMVFLYSTECGDCELVRERLLKSDARLCFCEVPPVKDHSLSHLFLASSLDANHDWFVVTPLVYELENGTVKDILSREELLE